MASPPPSPAPRSGGHAYGPAVALPGSTAPLRRDTAAFASRLCAYARGACPTAEPWTPAERHAAASFDWSQPVHVARAPGRLDVMGGVADYSGALVLQMPLAEACHVAIQRRRPPSAPSSEPSVRITSLPARGEEAPTTTAGEGEGEGEVSRRAETFEMPVAELFGFADDDAAESASDSDSESRHLAAYARLRDRFGRGRPSERWAAYVAGVLLVFHREHPRVRFLEGESVAVVVRSDVPEGAGVSSSAALEVGVALATLSAFAPLESESPPSPPPSADLRRLAALLCQRAENLVAGAPCGVMDQMASACGLEGKLLALLCRPCEIVGFVDLPPGSVARVVGVDSGKTHELSGGGGGAAERRDGGDPLPSGQDPDVDRSSVGNTNNPYGDARVAAFMCRRALLGRDGGYLTEAFTVAAFDAAFAASGLARAGVRGAAFDAAFPGGHGDEAVSGRAAETRMYAVEACGRHPVAEHERVARFKALLEALSGEGDSARIRRGGGEAAEEEEEGATNALLRRLGDLMLASHASYGTIGLGAAATDAIVDAARRLRPEAGGGGGGGGGGVEDGGGVADGRSKGFDRTSAEPPGVPSAARASVFGAKITGGGSGGTVAALVGAEGAEDAIRALAAAARRANPGGNGGRVFEGSGPGGFEFGRLVLRCDEI